MNPTKNDLPQDLRTKLVDLLNARLAETIDFKAQAKQAHWNVKGPHFYSLHLLFDQVAEAAEEAIDEIAERAVALGGTAIGTVHLVSQRTKLPDYPTDIATGHLHVEALTKSAAMLAQNLRKAIDTATEWRDADTADLFTGVSREVDKYLWMLEAHLQNSGK